MAFTAPTEQDIGWQEGTYAWLFTASGAIQRGQGVYLIGNNTVCEPANDHTKNGIGVAMWGASHGDKCAIYCVGNIVRCEISGTQTAGTLVALGVDGQMWTTTAASGRTMGIIVDGTTDTVMLF